MTKNISTLILVAPLLFSACSSTTTDTEPTLAQNLPTIQKVPTVQAEQLAQTIEVEPVTTMEVTTQPMLESKTTTVTYVTDKSNIEKLGNENIKSFMMTLKSSLKSLIQIDKSYQSAMGGCASIAQSRTDEYNAISETKVRRTALKYRNPKNKPDETDTIVMERFVGENSKKSLVVDMSDSYRVYKPLYIQAKCMACHGENISPALQKILKRTYPKDMATGFQLGEFRGVVVADVKK